MQAGQRPPEYAPRYDLLFGQWRDRWLREFVPDMVVTYLVGPAFGWQHVRLSTRGYQAAYFPALGQAGSHPADEARLRGILAVLERMGVAATGSRIKALWDGYLAVSGEQPLPEYEVCYPQALIESLARRTVEGCRALDIASFDEAGSQDDNIPSLLREAWGPLP